MKNKIPFEIYHTGFEISFSHIFEENNSTDYSTTNSLHVNPDFISRLEKFKGFLTANLQIFKNDFQQFVNFGNDLMQDYPVLTPLANDIYHIGCRLEEYILRNDLLMQYEQQLSNTDYANNFTDSSISSMTLNSNCPSKL